MQLWLGMVTINSTVGTTCIVVAYSEKKAETALFAEWSKHVDAEWRNKMRLNSFSDLEEWNDAAVREIPTGKAVIWEQLV